MKKSSKKTKITTRNTSIRCSDYDNSCKEIKDHVKCFIGLTSTIKDTKYSTDTADGYCPFIHQSN